MAFYVFDLDGTLADCDHRRHLLPNWKAFFEASDKDAPIVPVINIFKHLVDAGHEVEVWSGCSAEVEQLRRDWLGGVDIDPDHLTRMRPIGNYDPDEKLKREWLHESTAAGRRPDAIFDDRQKVVDMWRAEGVQCFQVNPGDFDSPKTAIRAHPMYDAGVPLLVLMVGPSGAGKTSAVEDLFDPELVVTTDYLRKLYTLDTGDQSRNVDVFRALEAIVKTRMECGLLTVVDATNIRAKHRTTLAKLTPAGKRCAYVVINRPVAEKQANAGRRAGVMIGNETLIDAHERVFQANLKLIRKGDGLPYVDVFFGAEAFAEAAEDKYAAFTAQFAENEAAIHRTAEDKAA